MRQLALAIFFITGCGSSNDSSYPDSGERDRFTYAASYDIGPALKNSDSESAGNAYYTHALGNQCAKWVEYLGKGCLRFKCKGDCGNTLEMLLAKCGITECDPYDPRPYNPGYPAPN